MGNIISSSEEDGRSVECNDIIESIKSNDPIIQPIFANILETFVVPDLLSNNSITEDSSNIKIIKSRAKRKFGHVSLCYLPEGETKINYQTTNWGRLISDPLVNDPTHLKGKIFRRRFRVPCCLFKFIVSCCKKNVFEVKDEERSVIPIEIKVLICLRVLGRDECFDTIQELSQVVCIYIYYYN